MNLSNIQTLLKHIGVDAWFLYDFRGSNSIAWDILSIPPATHCTRRWAVIIPAKGQPIKLVHAIENFTLECVHAREIQYSNRHQWLSELENIIKQYPNIALEYSPNNDIPTASKVDGGTVELLRLLGANLHSSADIIQHIQAVWSPEQMEENCNETAPKLRSIMMEAFLFIRDSIFAEKHITEFDVQKLILELFEQNDLLTDHPPIVAIGKNAASPHYGPTEELHSPIHLGDVVLIDMWATANTPKSTFADITWMGYVGENVPERVQKLFSIIAEGRDAAVELVNQRFTEGQPVYGYEVDDACRKVITDAGYGTYFIHRTGHSITHEIHGSGANIDNFETCDRRQILPNTSFSIEPGIYITDSIGLRTEIDVVISENGEVLIPSEPIQRKVLPLLATDSIW
ncbi:MAG: aminopeptidase P family protein [Bacteroidetes bacterium]|nr:aminopeptidase P family protein [Bacteroidota bacterium]